MPSLETPTYFKYVLYTLFYNKYLVGKIAPDGVKWGRKGRSLLIHTLGHKLWRQQGSQLSSALLTTRYVPTNKVDFRFEFLIRIQTKVVQL